GGDREGKCNRGVDAVAHLQEGGDVRAGAKEGGTAEGILPAIAAEHVPALPHQCDQQCHDEKIEHDVGGGEQRHGREQGDDQHDVRDRRPPHARSPNRPRGRKSSTRMNMTKMPICPSHSPTYTPQRLTTTPMNRPPRSAPVTEPMPPSTTMVKAMSTKAFPMCGLT